MKILRTASLESNFTGSYKERVQCTGFPTTSANVLIFVGLKLSVIETQFSTQMQTSGKLFGLSPGQTFKRLTSYCF